ncbi:MAG: SDR family NAD(P)-dependent oxidoreductase [Chloroflexi bacterium]|nr:MAG: SDR family NAD(P)-dependent oxidoreductase [Chloroflexota bacterium]
MKSQKLSGKWALVTGSSRGIGQQIAIGLAQRGCNVIIHGRFATHTETTQQLLAAYDIKTHVTAGDVATDEGIQSIIKGVLAGPGYVDILYNNAAISNQSTPIFEFTMETWHKTMQVNLFAIIQLCNAFAPGMKERGYGRIINLTSGIADQPNLAPYSVSKAAVDKYSRDLSFALKDDNVLVNYLDPGWLKTDLGGPNAWDEVETVLPGALVPALLDDNGPTGRFYAAQDFKVLG